MDEVTDMIASYDAAVNIQAERILGHSHAFLVVQVTTLTQAGHSVPPLQEVRITQVYVVTLVDERPVREALSDYTQALRLDGVQGVWYASQPCFALCQSKHCPEESQEYQALLDAWPSCVFTNTFWRLMGNVNTDEVLYELQVYITGVLQVLPAPDAVGGSLKSRHFYGTIPGPKQSVWAILGIPAVAPAPGFFGHRGGSKNPIDQL